jgi:hypothetical protein
VDDERRVDLASCWARRVGYAHPFSVGGSFRRSGQLRRRLEDSGIEELFQIEDIIDMGLGDQQGMARVTGADGEEC